MGRVTDLIQRGIIHIYVYIDICIYRYMYIYVYIYIYTHMFLILVLVVGFICSIVTLHVSIHVGTPCQIIVDSLVLLYSLPAQARFIASRFETEHNVM